MSRSTLRPLLIFILLVGLFSVLVFTYSIIQIRTSEQRLAAEMLGTQAVTTVCATYTARGESPPQCASK